MQACRSINEVGEDGIVTIKVPDSFGKKIEVIILPVDSAKMAGVENFENLLNHDGGFCNNILAAKEEDIWNDL